MSATEVISPIPPALLNNANRIPLEDPETVKEIMTRVIVTMIETKNITKAALERDTQSF